MRRTVGVMDNRVEVREFLTSRRARINPEQAGLPAAGQRRVPGLRRSEVAALAGMSVEYYAKLERGSLAGVSAGVLDAIARALRLDHAERAHLLRLAHEADGSNAILRLRRRPKQWTIRPSLQWTLDSITTAPAIVGNNRLDLVAANHLGRAMYSDVYSDPTSPPNFARFTFLDSAARRFYPDWDLAADMTVANLRTATRVCTTWWESCPPAVTTFAAGGRPTTSASTAPGPKPSAITSWASSPWRTKAWTSAPNPTSP